MLSKKSILGSFIAMAMLAGCSSTPAAPTDASDASGSDFDSSNDITVISRESGSGTRGAFIELTGVEEKQGDQKVDMTTDDAQVVNSTSVVLTTVETDPYAIGYVSLGTLNDKVKAVKVDGAEATADAIKTGQYKLSRPFNIATKERTIFKVMLPAAASGVLAGIVLGVGRAIGETMAVVMIAGNQTKMPSSIFKGVRTMTANIVMEMGYATGLHREALIATGVVLFVFILLINAFVAAIKKKGVEHA